MNLLKKTITVIFILVIAIIDIKIVIDYEIIRPTEKYNITEHSKTVAKVLNLDNVHPEEVSSEILEEKEVEIEQKAEDSNETETLEKVIEKKETIEQSKEVSQPVTNEDVQSSEPEQIATEPEQVTIETPAQETVSNSSDIVATALQYEGYSYVAGGSSPETGFDCSGFTKYIYGLYGISLNRTASDQADNGTPINKEELQPGDLLLFSYYGSDSIGHTGIYIGDGQFIHAANSSRGVVKDTIESGYYLDNYVAARRLY